MPDLAPPSAVACRMPAVPAPLLQRARHALARWWRRQCLQAERSTRFVPRY